MAVFIHPDPGDLLMCDFSGFKPPEMTKKRPVVVISPRTRRGIQLCTVVPLSTVEPKPMLPCHYKLSPESLPECFKDNPNWAKCDLLYTVALNRLDRIYAGRAKDNQRIYIIGHVSDDDLIGIRNAVGTWLQLK